MRVKHFGTERWVDFARGLLGSAEHAAMEAHLLSGCDRCRGTASVLARLTAAARAQAAHEPPAEALSRARALWPRRWHPEGERKPPTRLRDLLVFQAPSEALAAGVRGGRRPTQLLYHVGRFSVDLHLNREQASRQMALVGQIADRRDPGKFLADVPVRLLSRRAVAACAVSNQLGEFHLEYDPPRHPLWLEISVRGGKRIEIPLARFGESGKP